jgi:NitT/TauT family transport system substrate-binding protein
MNDLRLVGGCFNGSQVLFIAPADSPVNSVDDLAGRKIGVSSPTSITTYFAELVVRELGLEPGADVEIIDIGGAPDAWTGATQGVVDVAWSSPPLSSQLIAAGDAKLIFHTKDYVTDWTDQMLVATQPFINDRADVVQGFVTAVGQACELIRSNTDEAAEVYATAMDIDPEVAKAALEDPGLDSWDIEFDDAGIAANAEAALAMGQVEGEIDVEAMIIRDFVG